MRENRKYEYLATCTAVVLPVGPREGGVAFTATGDITVVLPLNRHLLLALFFARLIRSFLDSHDESIFTMSRCFYLLFWGRVGVDWAKKMTYCGISLFLVKS